MKFKFKYLREKFFYDLAVICAMGVPLISIIFDIFTGFMYNIATSSYVILVSIFGWLLILLFASSGE